MGLFLRGMMWVTITVEPEKIPADPIPAIARPRMNASEFGAAPHTAEPTSKIPIAVRKTTLVE